MRRLMQTCLPGIFSITNSEEKHLLYGALLGQIRVKILQTNLLAAAVFDQFFRISCSVGALRWIWNLNRDYFLVAF